MSLKVLVLAYQWILFCIDILDTVATCRDLPPFLIISIAAVKTLILLREDKS